MKSARITFHDSFPSTPLSGFAGARWNGWIRQFSASGQPMKPKRVEHPFLTQRKKWCLLEVHYEGLDLRFAMPEELDRFIEIMSTNPLPGGIPRAADGELQSANRYWYSNLPAKAKQWKFRKELCAYLSACPESEELRGFYDKAPVIYDFPDVYDSLSDAQNATYGRVED